MHAKFHLNPIWNERALQRCHTLEKLVSETFFVSPLLDFFEDGLPNKNNKMSSHRAFVEHINNVSNALK